MDLEEQMNEPIEEEYFMQILRNAYHLYFQHGARSGKDVAYFHEYIKTELQKLFDSSIYKVVLEHNVKSMNSSGNKRCDVVVLKNSIPYIIFPVKIIKTNYHQNKNNYWESLTGELSHLKWANENINIIPINILMSATPYLKDSGKISKFEKIDIEHISNYNTLTTRGIAFDVINYIMEVEHESMIGENYNKCPIIVGFNHNTPYRSLSHILRDLL
jgi:hypothetical protein